MLCQLTSFHYLRYPDILRFLPLVKVLVITARSLPLYLSKSSRGKLKAVVAHNFWTDGAPVFFISLLVPRLKYVVVVRSTDVAVFFPKLPHFRWLMRMIAARSEGVLFVSPAHFQTVQHRWPALLPSDVAVSVVGNGISQVWAGDICTSNVCRPCEVCFVGNFGPNKNLKRLFRACEKLRGSGIGLSLTVIGGSQDEFKRAVGIDSLPSWTEVMGYVDDADALKAVYRRARVIAVPSIVETFGLVYVEALSQGASVVCSMGQGIDGFIESDYVKYVDPLSEESIAGALDELLEITSEGVPLSLRESMVSKFDWRHVCRLYLDALSLPESADLTN